MPTHRWDRIEEEQLNPLVSRKVIHTGNTTIARLVLRKFAVVPEHSHENEQITVLESGLLKFVVEGRETVMKPGDILVTPPHAKHFVEALEDCVALDLFSPRREDWIRGDDAYLRR